MAHIEIRDSARTSAFWGIEEAVPAAAGRVLAQLPARRRDLLTRTVTLDVDATEIEVFGRKKKGAKHGHTGALRYLADIAHWAETGIPLVADLLDGTEDPRAGVVDRLTRAVHVLPVQPDQIRARLDTGYFAIDVAQACVQMAVRFAIGVRRNQAVLRNVLAIDVGAWHHVAGMPGSQVAVMNYLPSVWVKDTDIAADHDTTPIACLVRRTRIEAADLPTERARRRKRAHLDQLQLALDGVVDHVYLHSFVLTNRDAKHGAAARHAPPRARRPSTASGSPPHSWPARSARSPHSWQACTGRASICRLRREIIRVPARVRRARDGTTRLHPPPGFPLLDRTLTALQELPTTVD